MIGLIITSIILVIIMLVFVFILFKNIIKRIDDNAKAYFVNKMHNYDYILEEKQDNLKKLNEEIDAIKAKNENIIKKSNDVENEGQVYYKAEETNENLKRHDNIKFDLNVPEYRDANRFFSNYKKIKRIFTINNEQIINSFVKKNKSAVGERKYRKLKQIRDSFDDDSIYSCMTLSSKDQIKVLDDLLTPDEKKAVEFDELIKKENFDINYFINYVERKMMEFDPTIYVYVNEVNINYNNIDKNIVTRQYRNMAEGIIIEYRNKIYDYSI